MAKNRMYWQVVSDKPREFFMGTVFIDRETNERWVITDAEVLSTIPASSATVVNITLLKTGKS